MCDCQPDDGPDDTPELLMVGSEDWILRQFAGQLETMELIARRADMISRRLDLTTIAYGACLFIALHAITELQRGRTRGR